MFQMMLNFGQTKLFEKNGKHAGTFNVKKIVKILTNNEGLSCFEFLQYFQGTFVRHCIVWALVNTVKTLRHSLKHVLFYLRGTSLGPAIGGSGASY